MKLVNAYISGIGRIAGSKINLDGKVVAVVGPNEAGKTTLLKALARLESSSPLPLWERSRAIEVPDDKMVVSARYILDESDRAAVSDVGLESEPLSMTLGRLADGGPPQVEVFPRPIKNRGVLQEALADLKKFVADPGLQDYVDPDTNYNDPGGDAPQDYVDPDTNYNDPGGDAPQDFQSELASLTAGVQTIVEADDEAGVPEGLKSDAEILLTVTLPDPDAERLRAALTSVIEWLEIPDPRDEVQTRLWRRTPDMVLFEEKDRTLESSYMLDDALLSDTPAALRNLLGMAEVRLEQLLAFHQAGDIGRRQTLISQANTKLGTLFAEAWKQSSLSVQLSIDGPQLRVMVWENGDSITLFSERSAGLRMFISLIAFLKIHGTGRPTILLIDEAENHLHIDAQADLVGMFISQQQAAKVIYTTHSPACLPPDLGSGIRSVVPRSENQLVSDIRNNFWGVAPGFTPLMMAMGAAAAAFTPARRVVLAEGASEMVLLPSLIRKAVDLSTLDYQVAPGLSESPKSFYPSLDLEAAKVAYLVDGDGGGKKLRKALVKSGIPTDFIVSLDVPGIENVLEASVYARAVKGLLTELNAGVDLKDLPELVSPKDASWAGQITSWAEGHGYSVPSKVAVASWLVENEEFSLNEEGKILLQGVHSQLTRILAIQAGSVGLQPA
ncbi:AAA family ATPase [Arthrobacter sp. RHLT1-20]